MTTPTAAPRGAPAPAPAAAPPGLSSPAEALSGDPLAELAVMPTWRDDQVMVAPAAGADLASLAAAYGAEALRPAGRSGYGVISVPGGLDREALLEALRADPAVADAAPQGVLRGAADGEATMSGASLWDWVSDGWGSGSDSTDAAGLQWHLDGIEPPSPEEMDVIVAVLDSGVAYTEHEEGGVLYAAAPSLCEVDIASPWDFVNDDELPLDDNQHGTHIASIIASSGEVMGVAPGAKLMPLKVLDHNNQGVESDLVEALYHAVDNGADVINMSLAFGSDYLPSVALRDALRAASDAGVVMVGAAGNAALSQVAWPAASPLVIAVTAGCMDETGAPSGLEVAPYANRDPSVELLAPGGCLDRDNNGDGYPDGILAETIDPSQPDSVGLWFYAGTSQAAALVSGAAAWLVHDGADAAEVRRYLQTGSWDAGLDRLVAGEGIGELWLASSLDRHYWGLDSWSLDDGYHVSMLPYLEDDGGEGQPKVRVTVLDEDLQPARYVRAVVQIDGSSYGADSCRTNRHGECSLKGPAVDVEGEIASWRITAHAVVDYAGAHTPTPMAFASDELEAVVGAMAGDGELGDALLGWHWPGGTVDGLDSMLPSFFVNDMAVGGDLSPTSYLFTPEFVDALATVTELEIDGSGVATSPFTLKLLTFDGTGVATSPFTLIKIATLDGTGVATSPFTALQMNLGSQAETGCAGCTLDGEPILIGSGSIATSSFLSNSALQEQLDAGGWQPEGDGLGGATLLSGSAETGVAPTTVGSTDGAGGSPL